MARYRLSGRTFAKWRADAHRSGDLFWAQLSRPRDGFNDWPTRFGRMECVIRTPTGSFTTVRVDLALNSANAMCPWGGAGSYEVRWYGSTDGLPIFYEITRAVHTFAEETSEHPIDWNEAHAA